MFFHLILLLFFSSFFFFFPSPNPFFHACYKTFGSSSAVLGAPAQPAAVLCSSHVYNARTTARVRTLTPTPLPPPPPFLFRYNNTRAGAAATLALSVGYTHIDTALGYGNQVGIAAALKASARPRESYFITSKIPGGLGFVSRVEGC